MTFPTVDGQRIGGRETEWQPMNQPQPAPQRARVDLAGLATVAFVVVGLALIVTGIWTAAGWSWGLVALGAALITVERWKWGRT